MNTKQPRSFGTHNGTFHADEVTACALLRIYDLIDEDKVIRTRDPHLLNQCEYVCDVGAIYDPSCKRFDHHQLSYTGPLSSAGMILLYLQETRHIDSDTYSFLHNSLVRGVDAHDTGKELHAQGVCTFSHIISNFTPIAYDALKAKQDAAFKEAVCFAIRHIRRLLERHSYALSCRETVVEAMAQYKECLFFEKPIPWVDIFFENDGEHHPAQFIIMPADSGWKLRAIPPRASEKMKVRTPLPKEWAGLIEKELEEKSGIKGAIFCHKGLFISVWKTKDAAIEALERVVKRSRS